MNVLLVDDDRFVIAALKKGIDWENLGITGVYTANNISLAKEIIQNERIDLLLSDIDMPRGSGLDLLTFVREQGNKVPAIFLTNYADFGYAKRALELRSFHYFLKPIDYEELTKIIKQALREISDPESDTKSKLTKLFLSYLMEGRITCKAFLQDASKLQPVINKNSEYIISIFQGFDKPHMSEGEVSEFADAAIATERVRAIYDSVIGNTFAEGGILMPYHSEDFLLIGLVPVSTLDISNRQGRLNSMMNEIAATLSKEFESPVRLLISGIKKIPDMKDELESLLSLKSSPLESGRNFISVDDSSTAALLKFVDDHFTEEISREQLSELFFFDPDYITKIFKRETGMSFKNYVIGKRLDLARKLLEETDSPVHDIALKVGYDNYSYFTRLFKKSYGITPIEFRTGSDYYNF